MLNAARRYKRVIQVGQWQRSGLHWKEMVDYIQSDKLGKINYVDVFICGGNSVPRVPDTMVPAGVNYDLWLGPAPLRSFNPNRFHYNFRWFWDYAGGKITDWGVHLIDMAMWALKLTHPDTIKATGGNLVFPNDAMETPDTLTVEYQFAQTMVVWQHNFGLKTNEYGFNHGLTFHGANGDLRASRNFWEVIPAQVNGVPVIEPTPRNMNAGNDLQIHVRDFLDAIKIRNFNTAANITIGRDAARVAHLGNIAYRTGLPLSWDSETCTFNEQAANHYLKPTYRKPWEIDEII
jgi:predicted dehydrogenase